jgi:hypothetical protein
MTKYELAYKFIPFLIDAFNRDKIPLSALLDKEYWAKFSDKETHEFKWEEIIIEHRVLSETVNVAVLVFPEPVILYEAKYGLIFFNSKLKEISYYLLEKTVSDSGSDDKWEIGSVYLEDGLYKNRCSFDYEVTVENVSAYIYSRFIRKKAIFGWLRS